MRKFLPLFVALFCLQLLQAQEKRVSWSIGLVSEGQWNMSEGGTRWANLFNADFGVKLWEGALFDASVLSTYGAGKAVADDRMGFSNIDAENRWLRLFHAGLSQNFFDGALTLFVGLKAADEDYFNTPLAGLFTGSAYGGIPTVTENHDIAVYPESALALHVEYNKNGWVLRETLMNGAPSDKVGEQFRFRPGRDGLFNIGSAMYAVDGGASSYTLGYAVTTKKAHGQSEFGVWGGVEQALFRVGQARLSLLAQGSKQLTDNALCRAFWATALVAEDVTRCGGSLGLAVSRLFCADGHETDIELTFNYPVGRGVSVQPAIHAIRTDGSSAVVGQLRLCYELGN